METVEKTISESIYPAYLKLRTYYEAILSKTTNDAGVWHLPNGDAYYQYLLRSQTTTSMTSEEVYNLGLKEVAQISQQMNEILESLGHTGSSVGEIMTMLARQEQFLYPESTPAEQVLADYQAIIDDIDGNLSELFDIRPERGVVAKRIPKLMEKTSSAHYSPPSMKGNKPGTFYANLRAVGSITKFGMRTLAYHEAIPGHHFQIALARKIPGIPYFRKMYPFNAFLEGWALYAEQLAWEYGFQKDPYNNLGRLQMELFRAVRLVVDTGIHCKRWTREQAISYMIEKTGMDKVDVSREIERYVVSPGQALGYKIGMMEILKNRELARNELGDAFDIKKFHNVILQNGSMPLSTLNKIIGKYIADAK